MKNQTIEKNQIQIFNHEQFGEITIIQSENSKVLFKANDVAKALGYSNPQKAIREHCKGVNVLGTPSENQFGTTVLQPTKFISEADIYRLVMRSKLPAAEAFQDWVVEEVLPSIRKTGAYMTPETLQHAITEPDFLIKLATNLKMEQEGRKLAEDKVTEQHTVIVAQENTMKEMTKRATFVDYILSEKKCVRISQIASEYGISAQRLNSLLYDWGIQKKVNDQWLPKTKYAPYNYMKSVTATTEYGLKLSSMWTQAGRLFLYRFLKEKGIIPLFEKEQQKPMERLLFDEMEVQ